MRDTKVLLYSGGMDSVCAAFLGNYDVLLRVPSGGAYDTMEEACCEHLAGVHAKLRNVVTVAGMFNFTTIERSDGIVPNRNAHLVLAASLHGDDIHLAAVQGDRSCDKDEEFTEHMRHLLDHMWQGQHWTPKRTFYVGLPVKHLWKSALLKEALTAGMPHTLMYLSYSCYAGGKKPCGVCKPCVRKYVAMASAGVHVPGFVFEHDPHDAPWLPGALDECRSVGGWRCGGEDLDFLRVFV